MATSSPLPRTLSAWVQALEEVRLPTLAIDQQRARTALLQEHRSLHEIADQVQNNPGLALLIIREANRGPRGLSEPAESLEVALTRIGLRRALELLARMPVVTLEARTLPLLQLQLMSRHASHLASGLFSARLARLWQEVHWNTLLFLAPVWVLACANPELFAAWEQRVLARGEPAAQVERELLGLPVLEICLALVRQWHLPNWIIEGYRLLNQDRRLLVKALHIARNNEHPLEQQQALDADPELRRWLTQPGNTPVLANGLAVAVHHSWSGQHTLRWECLTALYLKLPLSALQQMLHQHSVSSARQHSLPGLWHPAQALVQPWNSHYPLRQGEPAARATNKPAAATTEPPVNEHWRRQCMELLQTPSPFGNQLQLTNAIRQTLSAAGLRRALLLQVDRARNLLVARQSFGLPGEANLLQLNSNYSPLLRQLLERPRQLQLTPDNSARFSALLPGALKSLFDSQHLLIRSLASQDKVAMLIVADLAGAALDDAQLQLFSRTAQCIERALDNYGKRGH